MEQLQFQFENGWRDAYELFGVRMGNGFIASLLEPRPIKERIENRSRMQHGSRIVMGDTKYDSRDVTLIFVIQETDTASYDDNKAAFYEFLESGQTIFLRTGINGNVYRLVYLSSTSYAENYGRTVGSVAVKFKEPNTNDR